MNESRRSACLLLTCLMCVPCHAEKDVDELVVQLGAELPNERLDAAKALAELGPEQLPGITAALTHENWRVRRGATDALAALKEDAEPAVPALLLAAKDQHAWVRDGAVTALGAIGVSTREVVTALALATEDESSWVRYGAIRGLTGATKDPEVLVPVAIKLLHVSDSNWRPRGVAVRILKSHGRDREGSVEALLRVIEDPGEGMWNCTKSAVEALGVCGASDELIFNALMNLVRHDHWAHRATACGTLAGLGTKAEDAIPHLRKIAADDPHDKVRRSARQAVAQLEKPPSTGKRKK